MSTPPPDVFGLRWGIKRSFLDYVRRMPDGRGAIGEGAVPVGTHEVLWAPDTIGTRQLDDGSTERRWTFQGDVRFTAHAGMMFVRLAAPWITLRGSEAQLSVESPTGGSPPRLPLVTFDLEPQTGVPGGVEVWLGSRVRLCEGAVEVFNDVYAPGEAFDDLVLTLPVVVPGD